MQWFEIFEVWNERVRATISRIRMHRVKNKILTK